jgi:hypothetical protein
MRKTEGWQMRTKWQASVILCLLICCNCYSEEPSGPHARAARRAEIIHRARDLSVVELAEYVHRLGKEKDLYALRVIFESNLQSRSFAACEFTRLLQPEKAVAFCASLPLDSDNWRAALVGLSFHPHKIVIGYYLQLATSSIPTVRYCCYQSCLRAGWGDLIDVARNDITDDTEITSSNGVPGQTLGKVARMYVKKFAGKR